MDLHTTLKIKGYVQANERIFLVRVVTKPIEPVFTMPEEFMYLSIYVFKSTSGYSRRRV